MCVLSWQVWFLGNSHLFHSLSKSQFHWNAWNELSAYFLLESKIAFDSKLKLINYPESKIASSLFVGGKRNLHLIEKITGMWGCMSVWRRLGWRVFVCVSQIPVQSYCSAAFPQQWTTKWQLLYYSGTICLVNPAILFLPGYDKFYLIFPRK